MAHGPLHCVWLAWKCIAVHAVCVRVQIVCFRICATVLEVHPGQAMHARKSRHMIWRFRPDFLRQKWLFTLRAMRTELAACHRVLHWSMYNETLRCLSETKSSNPCSLVPCPCRPACLWTWPVQPADDWVNYYKGQSSCWCFVLLFGTFVLQDFQFHFLIGYYCETLAYLPWLKYCHSAQIENEILILWL